MKVKVFVLLSALLVAPVALASGTVAQKVEEATAKHQAKLEEVSNKVPDSAKDAIEGAKDASSKGSEQAVSSLDKSNPNEENSGNEEEKDDVEDHGANIEKSQEVLTEVQEKVPDQAKDAIGHAMEAKEAGQAKTSAARNK